MPRYRMTVEYDGTSYVGWQRQENGHSVQAALEGLVLSLTSEAVSIKGAGRTDSGVHAFGQVAHVYMSRDWAPYRLRTALTAPISMYRERCCVLDHLSSAEGLD